MKHVGIIAEYNPFHNGHAYQLQKVREQFPNKKIIIIMSGNYVQRGEPAIYNKYLRTNCALQENADILFELPLLFATSSAEHFASASVLALSKTGMVDTLCFGAETEDLSSLKEIAHFLLEESDSYKLNLQKELRKGLSYPKARAIAVSSCINKPNIANILKQPNNILAIEYLKAIEYYHLDITPVIIKRIGSGYHDTTTDCSLSSATAIRNALQQSNFDLTNVIPANSWSTLQNSAFSKPLFATDFYCSLQYVLWKEASHLEDYLEVSEDLANKLRSIKQYPMNFGELLDLLSSKTYTITRLQRALLNILLGLTKQDMEYAKEHNYITYLRLLGFRKDCSYILKDMKEFCTIPIINKVANAHTLLTPQDYKCFEKELYLNRLYAQIFYNKYGVIIQSEYEHSVIISQ